MSEAPIARRVLERLRAQVRSKVVDLAAFRAGNEYAETLQHSVASREAIADRHPAHAIYTHVQHTMSVMAEQLLRIPEMKHFAKIIGEAHEEYLPSWPPMSPISTSYFWCWSTFDATANAHRETLGAVTLKVAAEFGAHPKMLSLMRTFTDSRMSVYRVEGHTHPSAHLRDLLTNQSCSAICESGNRAITGELWFTRVLPPVLAGQSEHVVFTSPYVLLSPEPAWIQYFDRIAAKSPSRPRIEALERNLKWGLSRRYWPEFVFEGYVNHQPGAIFLKGLPDVPHSRPHSKQYVPHVD